MVAEPVEMTAWSEYFSVLGDVDSRCEWLARLARALGRAEFLYSKPGHLVVS